MCPTNSSNPDGYLTALYCHNTVTEQDDVIEAARPFLGTDRAAIR